MTIYRFDATVSTHDDLKAGRIALKVKGSRHAHHRIIVAADSHTQAFMDAAAMVMAHGYFLTGLYDRI